MSTPIGAAMDAWSALYLGEFFEGGPVFLQVKNLSGLYENPCGLG